MKRCPECGRNYNDDSMSFCLDDGSELLFGPASMDEPATAILSEPPALAGGQSVSENPTRPFIHTTAAEAEPQKRVREKKFPPPRLPPPLIAAFFFLLLLGVFCFFF